MKLIARLACAGASIALLLSSSLLLAQETQKKDPQKKTEPRKTDRSGGASTTRTTGASMEEPPPPPPKPEVEKRIVKEAGVGGPLAYARRGVLELGGSTGLSRSSNFTQLNISPSAGWFFTDNVELSGIIGFTYVDTDTGSSTFMTLLAEPSYHLPVSDTLFPFLGLGAGIVYSKGAGTGFALAPRLGLSVLIGRSGLLTPAILLVYSTTNNVEGPSGAVAVNASYGFNVGYTVMW